MGYFKGFLFVAPTLLLGFSAAQNVQFSWSINGSGTSVSGSTVVSEASRNATGLTSTPFDVTRSIAATSTGIVDLDWEIFSPPTSLSPIRHVSGRVRIIDFQSGDVLFSELFSGTGSSSLDQFTRRSGTLQIAVTPGDTLLLESQLINGGSVGNSFAAITGRYRANTSVFGSGGGNTTAQLISGLQTIGSFSVPVSVGQDALSISSPNAQLTGWTVSDPGLRPRLILTLQNVTSTANSIDGDVDAFLQNSQPISTAQTNTTPINTNFRSLTFSLSDLEGDPQHSYQVEIIERTSGQDTTVFDSDEIISPNTSYEIPSTLSFSVGAVYLWRVRSCDIYAAETEWGPYSSFVPLNIQQDNDAFEEITDFSIARAIELRIPTQAGVPFSLFTSNSLTEGSFTPLIGTDEMGLRQQTNILGDGNPHKVYVNAEAGQKFFRLVEE